MDQITFLSMLKNCLADKLPAEELTRQMDYYEEYFAQELAKGRTEEEITVSLGDPVMIARTVADGYARKTQSSHASDHVVDESGEPAEEPRSRKGKIPKWGCIVLVILFFLLFFLFGRFLSFLLPYLFPFLIAALFLYYMRHRQ